MRSKPKSKMNMKQLKTPNFKKFRTAQLINLIDKGIKIIRVSIFK